jgi:hypothetical protein
VHPSRLCAFIVENYTRLQCKSSSASVWHCKCRNLAATTDASQKSIHPTRHPPYTHACRYLELVNSRKLIERADSGIHSFWKRWIQSIRMGRRRRTCWIDIFVCGPFITSGANSNFEIHSEAESRQDKATIFTRTYQQNFTSSHFKLLSLGH